jgi:hypothetical protein
MALVLFDTYSMSGGAAVKYCFGDAPSKADPPWVTVSIRRDVDPTLALRALRALTDEIEMAKWDPDRL